MLITWMLLVVEVKQDDEVVLTYELPRLFLQIIKNEPSYSKFITDFNHHIKNQQIIY